MSDHEEGEIVDLHCPVTQKVLENSVRNVNSLTPYFVIQRLSIAVKHIL